MGDGVKGEINNKLYKNLTVCYMIGCLDLTLP